MKDLSEVNVMSGADLNLTKLNAYISVLETQIREIEKTTRYLDSQFDSLKAIWKDEKFAAFTSQYNSMHDSINLFLIMSKKTLSNLYTKRIPLVNYLKN